MEFNYTRARGDEVGGNSDKMDDFRLIAEATHAELGKGLVEIVSVPQLTRRFKGAGNFRADERFIVHGAKPRPCENCRASKKNATCVTYEKVSFAAADEAAAVGRRSYDVSVAEAWDFSWEFGASGDDEPDAYRSSPVSDVAYSVFFFVDTDGVVRAGVPRGLNFGLRAAVVQYCRKPALVVAFLRRILMVPAHHYVDDFQVAEPSFCLGPEVPGATKLHQRFPASGQGMLWATYDLLGFRPLKPDKSSPWSSSAAPFIGTVSDFSELPTKGVVSISIKEETRIKARDLVRGALDTKVLAPQTAGKLYGKLRWVFCLGKVCLGALSEIKSRQYEGDPDCGDGALSDSLTEALHFLLHVLGEDALPAKLRTYSTRCPVLIWSDARWEKRQGMPFGFGRIGYVVRVPRLEGGVRHLLRAGRGSRGDPQGSPHPAVP